MRSLLMDACKHELLWLLGTLRQRLVCAASPQQQPAVEVLHLFAFCCWLCKQVLQVRAASPAAGLTRASPRAHPPSTAPHSWRQPMHTSARVLQGEEGCLWQRNCQVQAQILLIQLPDD